MEQTPQNTFDYDSCRRVWQRVSPELDPYPAGEGSAGCPAAPAPDLKRLQELIEGELGDRRAYLCAARCAPHPAARRTLQRMAADEGVHARRLLAVYYLAAASATVRPCRRAWQRACPGGPCCGSGITRRSAPPGSMTGRHKAPGMPACLSCSGTCPGTRPATPGS